MVLSKKADCRKCKGIIKELCQFKETGVCVRAAAKAKHEPEAKPGRGIDQIVKELEAIQLDNERRAEFEEPSDSCLAFYNARQESLSWTSAIYIPHVRSYGPAVKMIKKADIVMDAGAGDFRLAMLLSQKAKFVYAIEINPELVVKALTIIGYDMPANLCVICGDYHKVPVPDGVNKIILLCNGAKHPPEWERRKIEVLSDGIYAP